MGEPSTEQMVAISRVQRAAAEFNAALEEVHGAGIEFEGMVIRRFTDRHPCPARGCPPLRAPQQLMMKASAKSFDVDVC